ncbi:dCTP deaminase/dUTPase family protein [Paenibacillus tianjinensis]|uniref:Uncharacterized protein n=1 Tax=Paenibacillus tianjinensis TaxID=2810347 RepID=A0ABX7L5N0_9BACL|nr:hypothetical protein [Paenibacillus tianjinensis]QSF43373.1 hypothetical protein JRJ22_19090 [Paenibacillus tianjinensis]
MTDIIKQPFQEEVNDKILYFAKVKETAIIPSKRVEDGCYDIYADQALKLIIINPNEIVTIPTGIASAFSSKYRLDFQRERGSTGSIGLVPRCGQVDSGYRGEVFIKLQNVTNRTIIITDNKEIIALGDYVVYPMSKAICQAALEIVPEVDVIEITPEQLESIPSERGKGKIGSSNK